MKFEDLEIHQQLRFLYYYLNIINYINPFLIQGYNHKDFYVGITGQDNIYDEEMGKYVSERIKAKRDSYSELTDWKQWDVGEEDIVRALENALINDLDFDGHWGGGNDEDNKDDDEADAPYIIYVFLKNE